jgi:cell wall-associated NlpC family hydrolase
VFARKVKLKAGVASVAAFVAVAVAPSAASAYSCSGGSTGGMSSSTCPSSVPGAKAKLVNGKAIPPRSAPLRVKKVIWAANRIDDKPYVYGGGHGRWNDRGYDCSGAVSYALHGGRFLSSPLPSSSFTSWARPGLGKWITVFAHNGHAYAVIAGLRWDTSMTPGDGPGWSEEMRNRAGFIARHPGGF